MRPRLVRAVTGTIALIMVSVAVSSSVRSQDVPHELGEASLPRWNEAALARVASPPLGLPPIVVPADNPLTIEKISLGRKLFFDRRLSSNNTMSCAMCHIPEQGFTNNQLSTPVGVHGHSLRRNAPTMLNVAYAEQLFLDGRVSSLERQATVPLLNGHEMANPSEDVLVARVAGLTDYHGLFEAAFRGGPSLDRIGLAIASWERTLLAADSRFDRWRYGGQADALTAAEKRGFELFVGKGNCHQCHQAGSDCALFMDHKFHNTGIGYQGDSLTRGQDTSVSVELAPQVVVSVDRQVMRQVGNVRPTDQGRCEVTHDPEDIWRFRTPTLRNVELTAPYMHDGSLRTLEEVVRFYNVGGFPHHGLDPLIEPLGLNDDEVASIVAFLRSLTASNLAELTADARSVAVGN